MVSMVLLVLYGQWGSCDGKFEAFRFEVVENILQERHTGQSCVFFDSRTYHYAV
jgi:hypothetical protein